jgi:very-short-patch-repair endonuclease
LHHFAHKSPSLKRAALLSARAHGLRASLTVSEQRLWEALSAGKLGVHFKRQVPVAGTFIADFLAPGLRLVVEVDGSAHDYRLCADERRDEKLSRLGFHVLRLDAELVMHNLQAAVARVKHAVHELRR